MVNIVEKIECPNCGAPLKVKAGEIIITCEYCGTAVNLKAEKPFVLKHSIIPNTLSMKEAESAVKTWMKSGFAMPSDLARKSYFKKVELLFLPFYVVTAHATTEYEGILTRTGQEKPISDTITREYQWTILGRRSTQFPEREYTLPLSGKASFDLSVVEGKFLHAELDEKEAHEKTRLKIKDHQEYLAKEKVDHITTSDTVIDIKDCEFVHAPIWVIEYEYQGHVHNVIMDGATGSIIKGDIPVHEGGVWWIWIIAVLIIIFGILILFVI
ncbi:MAG: zinc ribbon domain-containing protein [Candidatus Methanofastidiosia archaeon]|jgi:hypothetical protein